MRDAFGKGLVEALRWVKGRKYRPWTKNRESLTGSVPILPARHSRSEYNLQVVRSRPSNLVA